MNASKTIKQSNKSGILIIVVVVAIVLTLTVFDGISKDIDASEIAISDYIKESIEFSGADGYGYINKDKVFDQSKFVYDVSDGEKYYQYEKEAKDCINVIYSDNNGHLSNGDEVEVIVEIDKALLDEIAASPKKIVGGEKVSFKYKVSGLFEGVTIDVFSNFEQYVTYSGQNGFGELSVNIPDSYEKQFGEFYLVKSNSWIDMFSIMHNHEEILGFSPKFDKTNGLKQGDIIRVSLEDYKDSLSEYDVMFTQTEIELVVPNLGDYVTSKDQLTKAHFDELTYSLKQAFGNVYYDDVISCNYLGTYAAMLKPSVEGNEKTNFSVCGVAEVSYPEHTEYYCYPIYEIVLNSDGSLSYEIGGYDYISFASLEELNTYMNSEADYTFEKIG